MGKWFYWGKPPETDDGYQLRTVRVADLRPTHSLGRGDEPRVQRVRRGERGSDHPITVHHGRIHDGHARVAVARERGQTHIQAWVKR